MRTVRYRRHPTEHQEQCAFVQHARLWLNTKGIDPRLLFAIPNAGAGAQKGQAGKMKAEGVVPGVPDLMLAVSTYMDHGLFIEMKSLSGKPSTDQVSMGKLLRGQGYRVEFAYGEQEAMRLLKEYIIHRNQLRMAA